MELKWTVSLVPSASAADCEVLHEVLKENCLQHSPKEPMEYIPEEQTITVYTCDYSGNDVMGLLASLVETKGREQHRSLIEDNQRGLIRPDRLFQILKFIQSVKSDPFRWRE